MCALYMNSINKWWEPGFLSFSSWQMCATSSTLSVSIFLLFLHCMSFSIDYYKNSKKIVIKWQNCWTFQNCMIITHTSYFIRIKMPTVIGILVACLKFNWKWNGRVKLLMILRVYICSVYKKRFSRVKIHFFLWIVRRFLFFAYSLVEYFLKINIHSNAIRNRKNVSKKLE